ncbi:hypothetical protein ACX3O0_08935 [Homoserinimonas sp. A447]
MSGRLSGFETLSGDEWQSLCLRILRQHHGPGNLIEIPDMDRGDGGLEAFGSNGHAYQCYAPEMEPLSVSSRRKKHLTKLNDDTQKFITNRALLSRIITPGLVIERWILLVPFLSSKAVTVKCNELTEKIRNAALPYASPSITVTALTLDSFELARRAVLDNALSRMNLPLAPKVSFADLGDPRSETMAGKLANTSIFSDKVRRGEMVSRLLENHLAGRTHREFILDQYTEVGDALESEFRDLEQRLSLQYSLLNNGNDALLSTILEDTEAIIRSTANVAPDQARIIAEGQVAEWLMNCPLDFVQNGDEDGH